MTALDGGTITAARIESIGTVGMTNRVEGGTLTTGKYDIVGTAGMTDVLDILDGGVVTVTGGAFSFGFGRLVGDTGSVTIDGAGSKLNVSGALIVGNAGQGTLVVRNHATETVSGLVLGQQESGTGLVQVITGAKLEIDSSVTLGGIGSGLTVDTNASVEIGGSGGAHANELRIDANGGLVGHGLISAGTLVNHGKIEAQGGTLVLNAKIDPTSDGAVKIDAGATLDLAARGAAGSGVITFGSGAQTLRIEKAALSHHKFGNEIDAFGIGDFIELPGLKFVKGAKATYKARSDVLKVTSGKETDKFTLVDPESTKFKVVKDGKGSEIQLVAKKGAAELASDPQSDHHHSGGRADAFQFVPLASPEDQHDHLADAHHSTVARVIRRSCPTGMSKPCLKRGCTCTAPSPAITLGRWPISSSKSRGEVSWER